MNKIPKLIHICINILIENNSISLDDTRITNVNISRVKTIFKLYEKHSIAHELNGIHRDILTKVMKHSSDRFLEQLNEDAFFLNYEEILNVIKYDLNLCRVFFSKYFRRFDFTDYLFHKTKYKTLQIQQALLEKSGRLIRIFNVQTQELCDIAFNNDYRCIEFINSEFITEEMCLRAVSQDGFLLCFLKHLQTIEICIAAVNQNGLAIEFVKNEFRTPQVCLLAVTRDFGSIKFIPDYQTDEICNLYFNSSGTIKYINKEFLTVEYCLKAIKKNVLNFKHIPIDQMTYELCKIAVIKFPNLLEFVIKKFQTEELCMIAVSYSYLNFQFIKIKTADLCLKLFNINHQVFREIDEKFQTEELCLAAVRYNGIYLQYVKLQSLEICLAAVTNNPNCFCLVKEQFQTEEICLMAIDYDWKYINLIKDQTFKLISLAINCSDSKAFGFILDEFKTEEVCLITVEVNPDFLSEVNQSHAVCLKAVKKKCSIFRFVKEEFQSVEICLLAVKGMGLNLKYVKNQTIEICSAAVANDPDAIKYVNEKFRNRCLFDKCIKLLYINQRKIYLGLCILISNILAL